jgi:hypothetical protein
VLTSIRVIDDVAAHNRVKFAQFDPAGVIAAVFGGQIHVCAFRAAHLDDLTWSFLAIFSLSLPYRSKALSREYSAEKPSGQIL